MNYNAIYIKHSHHWSIFWIRNLASYGMEIKTWLESYWIHMEHAWDILTISLWNTLKLLKAKNLSSSSMGTDTLNFYKWSYSWHQSKLFGICLQQITTFFIDKSSPVTTFDVHTAQPLYLLLLFNYFIHIFFAFTGYFKRLSKFKLQ